MRFGVILVLCVALRAQSFYQFGFDQDSLHGAPDFSSLNHPLTAPDRVFVRDGHFYAVGADLQPNTADDARIRFYGVNLAFGANFPEKGDAVRIAQRLRRLGINLVRLHHMDSSPDSNAANAGSTLTTGPYPTFNEVSLQRLRDFLAALASEGIYADLNLHVGYTFRPAIDQVPALPGQAISTQSKPLHIFHPRMVELQQQYAAQLIRKLGLRGSAALAMIEINNESSLIQAWQSAQLDPVLAGEYRTALGSQWNGWLASKYGTTAALSAAWGAGSADGADVLPGKWTLEQGHGKTGTLSMTTVDGAATAVVQPGQGSGWLFLKQTGFHLESGVRYVWRFEARADVAAGQKVDAPVSVMRDVSPWDGVLYSTVSLTNQWQTYTIAVTPGFAIQDSGRVSLDVEYSPGMVYVRNTTLVPAGQKSLAPGETVEGGTVSLLGPSEGATAARMADYVDFLVATDRAYSNALRDTVRAETDALVPVTGTQMGYGGLAILDAQDGLDYQDNHFYIDHYNFPNTAWDGFDWRIRDSAAADNGWGSLTDMAWARQAGRPYTVSEFNQPWPNTHGGELDPTLAAFGAFHDWDAIMHFAYSHARNWDDGVPNGFNINGDWTKFPVIGQSAWLFRTGAVRAGASVLDVPVSAAERNRSAQSGQSAGAWVVGRAGVPRETAFTRRVELAKDSAASLGAEEKAAPRAPYSADTGELVFDAAAKVFRLNAPEAAGVFGPAGRTVTAGPIDVSGGGGVFLTSRDGLPIAISRYLLLSAPATSLRTRPGASQPQRMVNYPGTTDWWTIESSNTRPSGDLNGGSRPTYLQAADVTVTLRTQAMAVEVWALDGTGEAVSVVPAERVAGGFRIRLSAATPWYAIHALQAGPHRKR